MSNQYMILKLDGVNHCLIESSKEKVSLLNNLFVPKSKPSGAKHLKVVIPYKLVLLSIIVLQPNMLERFLNKLVIKRKFDTFYIKHVECKQYNEVL